MWPLRYERPDAPPGVSYTLSLEKGRAVYDDPEFDALIQDLHLSVPLAFYVADDVGATVDLCR